MAALPDVIVTMLQTIHADVQDVKADQKSMGATLTAHIETEPKEWAELLTTMTTAAFPDGDAEGHRHYHEETIRILEARTEFWKKMLFEVTKYGLFGVIGWLAYTVWVAFLHGPQK